MGLSEGGNDLGHLEAEFAPCIAERCAVAVPVAFMPFGRMGPDLDADARKRRAVSPHAEPCRSS